jgi:hypothetical protein
MVGVAGTDIESQVAFAAECCTPALRERTERESIHAAACASNGEVGFGAVEADFLYCFVAAKRPPRIVQVGAGVSTAVVLAAAEEAGYRVDLTCVEPYPTEYLQELSRRGEIRLLSEEAQSVSLSVFTALEAGDLLFIDSTHAVRVDGEVNRIVLEVLPRLGKGVYVHFHDICFPYDYSRSVLTDPFFPTESTLLHAFLACNDKYRVLLAMSMLHYAAPERLRELLPNYTPAPNDDGMNVPGAGGHFPSSIYLHVV